MYPECAQPWMSSTEARGFLGTCGAGAAGGGVLGAQRGAAPRAAPASAPTARPRWLVEKRGCFFVLFPSPCLVPVVVAVLAVAVGLQVLEADVPVPVGVCGARLGWCILLAGCSWPGGQETGGQLPPVRQLVVAWLTLLLKLAQASCW